jgi:hypothetical protein
MPHLGTRAWCCALAALVWLLADPPAAARRSPSGTGVWAVMIGINDYPGQARDLQQAGNDAGAVSRALSRYGVPLRQQLLLREGQADLARVHAALDWLVANAGPRATAVFFFAGHVRKGGPGRQAMVTADGRSLTDRALAAKLGRLRAPRAWLVFASCYGGGFDEVLRPGRVLTAAADGNSLAYEASALGHSYLVSYMVEEAMIGRRADQSVESAFAWAVRALRREHPNRVPVQYDRVRGDLRLGPSRNATTTTTATPRESCLGAGSLLTCVAGQ